MFRFQQVVKSGGMLKRNALVFRLSDSLEELFGIYDQMGGPRPEAATVIDRRLEQSLGEPGEPRGSVRARFHLLLRAKELHRFVTQEPALAPLRMRWAELMLFFAGAAERWSAVRDLLADSLHLLCPTGVAGHRANLEHHKQQLSLPSGTLGSLLVGTALFNFDRDEEAPPPNLMIRFTGRFPEHRWEIVTGQDAAAVAGDPGLWRPANPLCRWEYLAADLAQTLFQRADGREAAGMGRREGTNRPGLREPPAGEGEHVYCTFEPQGAGGEQVELFPLEAAGFRAELQRRVHRRFQSEGLRVLALVMEQLGRAPGEVVTLHLSELGALPGREMTPAKCRARAAKAAAVVDFLSRVRLTRIAERRGRSTACSSNFLTVLDLLQEGPAGNPHQPCTLEKLPNAEGTRLRLVADSLLFQGEGQDLAAPFQGLPPGLLETSPREHPFALGLYIYLRRAWHEQEAPPAGVAQGTARQLFHDAGFWVSESARYRALEGLRRDLDFLRERGWLGSWRMIRSSTRDAMDDQFRMEAPNRKRQRSLEPVVSGGSASLVSA